MKQLKLILLSLKYIYIKYIFFSDEISGDSSKCEIFWCKEMC